MCGEPSEDFVEFDQCCLRPWVKVIGSPGNVDRCSPLKHVLVRHTLAQILTITASEVPPYKVRIRVRVGVLERYAEADPGGALLIDRPRIDFLDNDVGAPFIVLPDSHLSTGVGFPDLRDRPTYLFFHCLRIVIRSNCDKARVLRDNHNVGVANDPGPTVRQFLAEDE